MDQAYAVNWVFVKVPMFSGERDDFSTSGAQTADIHMGKYVTWLLSHDIIKKVNSKWSRDLSLKSVRIKLLEENIGKIFLPWSRQRFLRTHLHKSITLCVNYTQKIIKINLDFIKSTNLLFRVHY